MEIRLAGQTAAFLWSIAAGAGLGFVYDIFRVSRIAVKTHKSVVFIEDIVFFMFCAAVTFLFLMGSVEGKVRFFLLTGEFLGALLYYLTVGRLVIKASGFIINLIKSFFMVIFRYILHPVWRIIYFVVTLILRPLRFIGKILRKSARKLKFSLKIRRIVLYNRFTGLASGILRKSARRKVDRDETGENKKEEP